MYALVALVILSIAPDQPLRLVSANRFATEDACAQAASQANLNKLVAAYKMLGLEAEAELKCVPTGQRDI